MAAGAAGAAAPSKPGGAEWAEAAGTRWKAHAYRCGGVRSCRERAPTQLRNLRCALAAHSDCATHLFRALLVLTNIEATTGN
ncbi:hypothetical protein GCM10009646_59860 [Streptomyces aureus]